MTPGPGTGVTARVAGPVPGVDALLAVPATVGPATRVLVVLHGKERNAAAYADAWRDWAQRHDRLLVCPEFDRDRWPGAAGYNLGNVTDAANVRNPPRLWAFTRLLDLVRLVAVHHGLATAAFDLFGHSAGAQFAHRLPLWCPDAPLRTVIVANAGWFTVPDRGIDLPYGVRDRDPGPGGRDVDRWTRAPLVLMRGAEDDRPDPNTRMTPQARAQGPHRYARAGHMHRAGHAADPGCRWELIDVPGVAHDFAGMSVAAQRRLEGR